MQTLPISDRSALRRFFSTKHNISKSDAGCSCLSSELIFHLLTRQVSDKDIARIFMRAIRPVPLCRPSVLVGTTDPVALDIIGLEMCIKRPAIGKLISGASAHLLTLMDIFGRNCVTLPQRRKQTKRWAGGRMTKDEREKG
jgi:hypothetical protein